MILKHTKSTVQNTVQLHAARYAGLSSFNENLIQPEWISMVIARYAGLPSFNVTAHVTQDWLVVIARYAGLSSFNSML